VTKAELRHQVDLAIISLVHVSPAMVAALGRMLVLYWDTWEIPIATKFLACVSAMALGQWAAAEDCWVAFVSLTYWEVVNGYIQSFGGSTMPCANHHSGRVQGAGLCCAQVGTGLTVPGPGTILPVYQPGQADAGQIPAGRIVQVLYGPAQKCGSCMIVGSTSRKHPGKPVLKFVPGGPSCPTAGTGCCAL
jgi:hypothetical protein